MGTNKETAKILQFPGRPKLLEGGYTEVDLAHDAAEIEALLAEKIKADNEDNDERSYSVNRYVDVTGASPDNHDLSHYEDLSAAAGKLDDLLVSLIPVLGEFQVKSLASKLNDYTSLFADISYHEGVLDGLLKGE